MAGDGRRLFPDAVDEAPAPAAVEWTQQCPCLGLVHDAASHATFATSDHRCYAAARPRALTIDHQVRYCLTRFAECPIYVAAAQQAPTGPAPSPAASFPLYLRRWLWLALLLALVAGVGSDYLTGAHVTHSARVPLIVAASLGVLLLSVAALWLRLRLAGASRRGA